MTSFIARVKKVKRERTPARAAQVNALANLGNVLTAHDLHAEAVPLREAALDTLTRVYPTDKENIMIGAVNLANSYDAVGRHAEAKMLRGAYEAPTAKAAMAAFDAETADDQRPDDGPAP